jgi:methyl-accepting chemotaxis protein
MGIGKKLVVLIAVFVAGYSVFAALSFRTLNTLRIEGDLYNRIIMNKDLIADVLPPPEYIIESYLDVLQMADETDPAEITNFVAELNRLKKEYDERHQFWIDEALLVPGDMRDAMLKGAYDPAIKFYDIVFSKFIPAVQAGEWAAAKGLVLGDLKQLYGEHRASVDIVVRLATAEYEHTETTARASVRMNTIFLIGFALFFIIVAIIMGVSIYRSIKKPIDGAVAMLKDISEGEGDLTRRLDAAGQDELGQMSRYFNETLTKIAGLVTTIKSEAANLSTIGNGLSGNMHETAGAVQQINLSIQTIKERVINQSASVTETSATMEQVTNNIQKLNTHVGKQTEQVTQSSAAIEQMIANIRSVASTLEHNAQSVLELSDASEVGRRGLAEMTADIQEIAKESAGLMEINAVMQTIASQTNLLSMNAAIEAAHAGDAGKGFAVVADEIRKLAESSQTQSKTISAVLKKIKTSIDTISRSVENVMQKFDAIETNVQTVSSQTTNIKAAMEEQSSGSKQILDSISLLNEITSQVRNGSMEMLDGSKQVIRESKNLETVTVEITGGMNDMAVGAERINHDVGEVNGITDQNKQSIDVLVKAVSKFKVA